MSIKKFLMEILLIIMVVSLLPVTIIAADLLSYPSFIVFTGTLIGLLGYSRLFAFVIKKILNKYFNDQKSNS